MKSRGAVQMLIESIDTRDAWQVFFFDVHVCMMHI